MKTLFQRSLLMVLVLLLFTSSSFANLKKGRIGPDETDILEFITSADGITTISLIFDKSSTDLDLALGLTDSTLIAASISPESNYEQLQVGLVGGITYILAINHFEGATTSYRVIVNSGEQQTIFAAGDSGNTPLRKIEPGSTGSKLKESLNRLQRIKK